MEDYTKLSKNKNEGESEALVGDGSTPEEAKELLAKMKLIAEDISVGAIAFLKQEYLFLGGFIVAFAVLLFFTVEADVGMGKPGYGLTTVAFVIGGLTSIVSGYLGMKIAVYTNVRTTKECADDIHKGFVVAFRGGQVLGFTLVGLALLVLIILIEIYKKAVLTANSSHTDYQVMFEMVAGYGLGGSTVALFGRVGGGIYTKAADVGSDLAGKVV